MEGHAEKCVERYRELANKTTQQLYKVATPCVDDHQFKEEDMGSVGKLSNVCSQIVLQCLYLARIGRPDILWSVNKLARAVTKWTKGLARLISYIRHTCEWPGCMVSPRHAFNRRLRTREGPEPACVQTHLLRGGTRQRGRANQRPAVVPSSRRGKNLQWHAWRKNRAVRKGKWSPRGTGMTVLTYPRSAPRGTGKAGDNGQYSGEMGGSSPWTRPSAPGCGDTLKALASSAWFRVGIVVEDGSGVAIDWVTAESYSSARRRLNVQSGQRKGRKGAAAPYPSVAIRDRGHWNHVHGQGYGQAPQERGKPPERPEALRLRSTLQAMVLGLRRSRFGNMTSGFSKIPERTLCSKGFADSSNLQSMWPPGRSWNNHFRTGHPQINIK